MFLEWLEILLVIIDELDLIEHRLIYLTSQCRIKYLISQSCVVHFSDLESSSIRTDTTHTHVHVHTHVRISYGNSQLTVSIYAQEQQQDTEYI